MKRAYILSGLFHGSYSLKLNEHILPCGVNRMGRRLRSISVSLSYLWLYMAQRAALFKELSE